MDGTGTSQHHSYCSRGYIRHRAVIENHLGLMSGRYKMLAGHCNEISEKVFYVIYSTLVISFQYMNIYHIPVPLSQFHKMLLYDLAYIRT
jgi:hypothetical protein